MPQELVDALRHQRHSFMNHLQVVAGWLQLNKPERATAYLQAVRHSSEREGQLFKLADWQLLTVLLQKHALAEASETEAVWLILAPFEGASRELVTWLATRFDAALAACTAHGSNCRIEVTCREDAGEQHVELACYDPAGQPLAAAGEWKRSFVPQGQ